MKKSTLIMILSLVLAVALGVGGTLAYLQDTDEDVNVMTLGNVYIEQHEYERVTDENGDPVKGVEGTDFDADYGIEESYKLKEFTQGKPAYPAVYQEGKMDWDEFQQLWNQVGAPGSNDLFDPSMKNVVDKFVFVENTGKSDAYYRTIIAIEDPEGLSLDATTIHTSFNANSRFDYNSDKDGVQNAADSNKFYTVIDGTRYLVYVATYQEALTPDEVSRPSLLQLYLDPKATNDDVALFGETWDVLVVSQAVQTQGFADAQTALDTAFGPITADNNPWKKDGKDLEGTPAFPVMVSTADELVAAIANGGDIHLTADIDIGEEAIVIAKDNEVTLNLNGKKLTGANDSVDSCYMIDNKGKLTINGDGVIDFASTCDASGSIGDGYYTITNTGDLTINGGVIKNSSNDGWLVDGMGKIATAIDHKAGNLTINDGTIESTYRSLRVAPFGGNVVAEINGGKFVGQVWVQYLNGSKTSVLTVNGGEYGPVGRDGSSIYVDNTDGKATAVINDGIFNTKIGAKNLTGFVKGGTFATQDAYDNTNLALFAADNTVTVK